MPSTVIQSIQYDKESEVMRVLFLSGQVYYYLDVPYKVFLAFKMSRSKGRYLNQHIKNKYAFESFSF